MVNSRQCCWSHLSLLVALCACLLDAATESGLSSTSTASPTVASPPNQATPASGVIKVLGKVEESPTEEAVTGKAPTKKAVTEETPTEETVTGKAPTKEAVTEETPTEETVIEAPTKEAVTEETPTEEAVTEATTDEVPTAPPFNMQGCICDLTPETCDLGCCCDTVDCGVANLSTVFNGCPQKTTSGVCIEKWLMFRTNVDSSLVTVTDSLFCVRSEDKAAQSFQNLPPSPASGGLYHFSPPASTSSSSHSRPFYRVDDVIQTFMSSTSVRGLLRQPSPGPAAGFCINRNPAKFLRSSSMSCSRMLTPQSCVTDPTLNARSYFSDLSLLKIPVDERTHVEDFLISVTPLSEWPATALQKDSCVNVVKHVEFVIGYTVRGQLTTVTVNIVLADVDTNQLLQQTHTVEYKLDTPRSTSGGPAPTVGLKVGSPVLGRFEGNVTTLTTLSGECSSDPRKRTPILFTHNTISGCTFSSLSRDCSDLRSQIYGILQGRAAPDEIAMDFGSQLNWTRVITQDCPISPQESCDSGCLLPNFLSIQVLWARQGLVDFPQNYILGAKYIFKCRNFKCPLSSHLGLTTEVTFADTTVYPTPPRGSPQPDWKFPFGFFTRGTAELDRHIVINNACDAERVTWSLMLFTVTLLTGLQFFTR